MKSLCIRCFKKRSMQAQKFIRPPLLWILSKKMALLRALFLKTAVASNQKLSLMQKAPRVLLPSKQASGKSTRRKSSPFPIPMIMKWIKMFFRYYQNWLHNAYDYAGRKDRVFDPAKRPKIGEVIFKIVVEGLDLFLRILSPLVKIFAMIGYYLSGLANPTMKLLLPIIRPVYIWLRKPLFPIGNWISKKLIDFTDRADPSLFETPPNQVSGKCRQSGSFISKDQHNAHP
jgi:hypothetical protein